MAVKTVSAFDSIFPVKVYSVPTPQATPEIGSISSPGQSFGGFRSNNNTVDEAIRVSRAWSVVTTDLKACHNAGSLPSRSFTTAFELLVSREHERQLLQNWHLNEVSKLFQQNAHVYKDMISSWQNLSVGGRQIQASNHKLSNVIHNCMLKPWRLDRGSWSGVPQAVLQGLQYASYERWTDLVNSLSCRAELESTLSAAMLHCMDATSRARSKSDCWKKEQCLCRFDLDALHLEVLSQTGINSDISSRALATAASRFLSGSILQKRCFQVDWRGQTSVADRLAQWIENVFSPTVEAEMRKVSRSNSIFTADQVRIFTHSALCSIGQDRISALFEYIRVWPQSEGAVDDIKAYLALDRTSDKLLVCRSTENQLQRRLLHAGASTAEILGMYVNLINVFKRLDLRGVLLEKVSPVIRAYLRARGDAVNVLAESLFAEAPTDDADPVNFCPAITHELQNVVQDYAVGPKNLEWDDMTWMPEPIDAATSQRTSRADDVLACILSLFDQDDLIKEFDTVLAQHLLSTQDPEIGIETRLLELLKTRLDAAKLQNAEIMLKDIRDSLHFEKRLRAQVVAPPTPQEVRRAIPVTGIDPQELYAKFSSRIKRSHFQAITRLVATRRLDTLFPKRGTSPDGHPSEMDIDAGGRGEQYRVLSSVSWPQVPTSTFNMPAELETSLDTAGTVFSELSGQRKLEWRHEMSRVSIELELEDRTIVEHDLPAPRVAVIDLFKDGEPWTTETLQQQLVMAEPLLHDSLAYWLGKRVLYQKSPGIYAVLERLDMAVDEDALELDVSTNAQDTLLRENAPMFEAFISNMLGNGGPKEITGMMGITNMLKMVLPTFTYGDDEVQWLLHQMQSKGVVKEVGNSWAAA